jgi:hypothetical protein
MHKQNGTTSVPALCVALELSSTTDTRAFGRGEELRPLLAGQRRVLEKLVKIEKLTGLTGCTGWF